MELPREFVDLMRQQLEPQLADTLLCGLSEEPTVSIRVNPSKISMCPSLDRVPWCDGAYYLENRPFFTFDPLFHAGVYYVQEASSMYLAEVLRKYLPSEDVVALDLCAAPGGKSTLIRSFLSADSLLVSNEPLRQRAQVLVENIVKWGHANCVVTQNYPEDFSHIQDLFDFVLVDAPCSGEGMFRKDEGAIRDWSLQAVHECQLRQRQILSNIWSSIKPGALVVYSTCTFNRFEDEDNASWIMTTLGASMLEERHFFPGRDRGEGFYLAVFRKYGEWKKTPFKSMPKEQFIALRGDFVVRQNLGVQWAWPCMYAELIAKFSRTLRVLYAGVMLSEQKGNNWMPAHPLALSTSYKRGTYPEIALSYEDAVAYLRRDTLRISADRGFVLLTYRGSLLGFAKSIGARLNNMYPQEWRIRTSYNPNERSDIL